MAGMQSVSLVARAIKSTDLLLERLAMSIPIRISNTLLFEIRVKIGVRERLSRRITDFVFVQDEPLNLSTPSLTENRSL